MTLFARFFPPAAALAAALALAAPIAAAEDDRENITPTGWAWYYGQTDAQIDALVASGLRIVDLDVESTSPYRFRAAFVRNSGSYLQSTWWWRYGYDSTQLTNFLSANNARITDLEPVVVGGALRFAFVAVPNTGSNAKNWWYYYAATANDVSAKLTLHNARLVDLERYTLGGNTYFAAVMISNTGADARSWTWYYGVSQAYLSSQMQTYGMRPYDLDRVSATTFDAIVVKKEAGVDWAWYFNVADSTLNGFLKQYGYRPVDIEDSGSGGFDALMLVAVNEVTQTVNAKMRALTDGMSGFYLKELNGSVLAGIQQGEQFEPASMLKTLHHTHAMRQVRLGNVNLGTMLTVTSGLSTDCPTNTSTFQEDLESVLAAMMGNSDNRRTRAVTDYFGGFAVLNATASALGMSETQVNHHIGCGTPANRLTLVDLGELHEAVANGWLGAYRAKYYDLMLNSVGGLAGGRFQTVLDEEAAKVGLSAAQKAEFTSRISLAYKGGSYGVAGKAYRCQGGYVAVPFYQAHQVVMKEHVAAAFVDGASDSQGASDASEVGMAEVLRDLVHDAMLTWKTWVGGNFTNVGSGCVGSQGTPLHTATGTPEIGEQVVYSLSNAPASRPVAMVLGSSLTTWNAIPLPMNLSVIGAPNCWLRTNPVVTFGGTASVNGTRDLPMNVPLNAALLGGSIHTQYLVSDPGANAIGITATRAVTTKIGGA